MGRSYGEGDGGLQLSQPAPQWPAAVDGGAISRPARLSQGGLPSRSSGSAIATRSLRAEAGICLTNAIHAHAATIAATTAYCHHNDGSACAAIVNRRRARPRPGR